MFQYCSFQTKNKNTSIYIIIFKCCICMSKLKCIPCWWNLNCYFVLRNNTAINIFVTKIVVTSLIIYLISLYPHQYLVYIITQFLFGSNLNCVCVCLLFTGFFCNVPVWDLCLFSTGGFALCHSNQK